jgi:hypothetical protein
MIAFRKVFIQIPIASARAASALRRAAPRHIARALRRQAFLVDVNLLAGARVAPDAGVSAFDREGAETAQLHAVAARHRLGDLIEDGVDDVLDVALVEMRISLGDPLHELRLDHVANPPIR